MKSSISRREVLEISEPIRCPVILADSAGNRLGIARRLQLDGVRVEFAPGDGTSLVPGRVVELISDTAPVGPIRIKVRVSGVGLDTDHRGCPVVSASLHFLDFGETERRALRARLAVLRPRVLAFGLPPASTESLEQA